MKLISLLVLLTTGFGFWVYCQTGTAQADVSSVSIAFCNPNKILQAYKKSISLRADLIDEQGKIRQKIMDAQKEIQTKSEELAVSGFSSQSSEYQEMRKDLVEKSVYTETYAKVSQNELRLQESQINEICFTDIAKAVEKIAKKKGLLMVFRQILYGDESLDITAEVIEQLNTDYELGE